MTPICTVSTFNSCTKCLDSPGLIQDRTSGRRVKGSNVCTVEVISLLQRLKSLMMVKSLKGLLRAREGGVFSMF